VGGAVIPGVMDEGNLQAELFDILQDVISGNVLNLVYLDKNTLGFCCQKRNIN